MVAGPRRRALVARTVAQFATGLGLRAVPGGWTVSRPTGGATVCRTLEALLDAVETRSDVGRDALQRHVLEALSRD
jgi:hypothetical protein